MCEIDHRKGLWVKNSIVLASKHCAYIQTMPSHIDKIFVAQRIFSSSILCVMTSTDNIIDAVVMCMCMIICQQVNPLNIMSRPTPAKEAKYIAVSIHWGKYCGYCLKKKFVEESCLPH